MGIASVEQKVRLTLDKVLNVATGDFPKKEELFAWGLDSIKVVELIVELEETFGIIFYDDELLFENFSTIQLIVDRIQGKLVAPS
ncbi:acyl carrier protein [Cohnella soli]|uniref:Acyl carrier protein n=1 Tax=Cohnella soli TaxID=425005 RepID=A0ABW0HSK7_9BACL